MHIGVIGLGRMGHAMAVRLVGAGHVVHGWDIDAERTSAIAAVGAVAAQGPSEVTARSEAVLSIVTDDAAARWLFSSAEGLLADRADGRLFIEMSTLNPATVRDIGLQVAAAGARLVGAPVMGTVPQVEQGKLRALAGGETEDVNRARAVLADLTAEVHHLGPIGSGNVMKLIVNLSMAAFLETLTEGFALGERHGLDIETMIAIIGAGPIANSWLNSKSEILQGRAGPTSLDIASLQKDVLSAVAAGSVVGVPMPMASGIATVLSSAVAAGRGADDLATLPKFFREGMLRRSASSAAR